MKKYSKLLIFSLFLFFIAIAGCAAGPNPLMNTADDTGRIYGFWYGLWHGIIFPVTFIISLFNHNVHFYEVHNNGLWYNIGYAIGLI